MKNRIPLPSLKIKTVSIDEWFQLNSDDQHTVHNIEQYTFATKNKQEVETQSKDILNKQTKFSTTYPKLDGSLSEFGRPQTPRGILKSSKHSSVQSFDIEKNEPNQKKVKFTPQSQHRTRTRSEQSKSAAEQKQLAQFNKIQIKKSRQKLCHAV